jgi:hypothetical protein
MRAICTRDTKYILNIANSLEFPFASDIYESPTWQGVLRRGDRVMGRRSLDAFLNRPREELYDLTKDPNELKNVASDPAYAAVLVGMRKRLRAWREETRDPWLILDRGRGAFSPRTPKSPLSGKQVQDRCNLSRAVNWSHRHQPLQHFHAVEEHPSAVSATAHSHG